MNIKKQKTSFTEKQHELFKNKFKIQEKTGNVELEYHKKLIKYIKYIKWIPGLQMIGIGNSISMNCASKDSDIDLLIVSSKNRLWIVRALITFIFSILGVRKTEKKHAGQFCLSFFTTTEGMNFGDFSIEHDIYLYFWILYFKPILSYNHTYENFININKSWIDIDKYQYLVEKNKSYIKYTKNSGSETSKFLTFVNNMLKKMLIIKTLKTYENLGKPYGIIINNDVLKFHNNDIRKKIRDEFM